MKMSFTQKGAIVISTNKISLFSLTKTPNTFHLNPYGVLFRNLKRRERERERAAHIDVAENNCGIFARLELKSRHEKRSNVHTHKHTNKLNARRIFVSF